MAVVIETTIGDVTVDLFVEERPRACLNFLKLCKLKYYNFNLFHTIERDFIAQTGDPSGVGDGGESIWGVVEGSHKRFFEAESLPKIKHTVPGLLSLVSVGKFMVGSQFFFTLGSDLTSLDGIHCVIGEVVEGHEVLRKLNEAIVDEKFRPYQDIRVTHTVILDDPYSDPRGFQVPSRSPSPSAERLQNGRIGADEDIDDTEGKTMEEIQEMLAEREAKARATILEIVGDLPDADIAPPENVLFVCKLNPVTTDDDLEIIFSRFGKVKSCEVIRDKVSGDSLQYAFVEFEEQKACEAAYFKMDNVLIDDRRIHVDFSQSVSKVQWRGKGRGVVHADERNKKMDFNNMRNDRRGGGKNQPRDRSRSPRNENNRRDGRRNDERNQDDRRRREGNSGRHRSDRSPNRRRPSPVRSRQRSPPREGKGSARNGRSPNRRHPSPDRPRRQPSDAERSPNRRRPSPERPRRRPADAERSPRRRLPSPDRSRRRSPDAEKGGRQVSDRRRHSPDDERRRIDERRPIQRRRGSPNDRQRSRSPRRREERPTDRGRDVRGRSPPRQELRRPQCDGRGQTQQSSKPERHQKGENSRPPPAANSSTDDSSSEDSDSDSKKKSKHVKRSKVKAKKRKKPVPSSSSSSSSESESESSTTSSSSSSSEEERRRKAKKSKSKKSHKKSNKRPKKKSKRRNSTSSSD